MSFMSTSSLGLFLCSPKMNKIFLSHFILYGIFTWNLKTNKKTNKKPQYIFPFKSFLSTFTHIFKLNLRMDKNFFHFKNLNSIYQTWSKLFNLSVSHISLNKIVILTLENCLSIKKCIKYQ